MLNIGHRNIDESACQELLALLASLHQDLHEGVDVEPRNPKFGSSALAAPDSAFGDNKFQLLRSSPYG